MRKKCTICKSEKDPSEFHIDSTRPDGRFPQCAQCKLSRKNSRVRPSKEEVARLKQAKAIRAAMLKELADRYGITMGCVSEGALGRGAFRITFEEFYEMYVAQDGKCAICSNSPERTETGVRRRLCIDHDHTTGRVRGLLCDSCNQAIGFLRDSEELVAKAGEYLAKQRKVWATL